MDEWAIAMFRDFVPSRKLVRKLAIATVALLLATNLAFLLGFEPPPIIGLPAIWLAFASLGPLNLVELTGPFALWSVVVLASVYWFAFVPWWTRRRQRHAFLMVVAWLVLGTILIDLKLREPIPRAVASADRSIDAD